MTAPSPYINVDLYCGGGGASEGFRMATGRDPDVAVNHDPKAIAKARTCSTASLPLLGVL